MLGALVALVGVVLGTTWWALLALAYLVPAGRAVCVVRRASGRDLVPALQLTGVAELAYGLGLFVGLVGGRGVGDVRSGMTFLIILVLIVAGVVAYKNRVTLIAKLTGQPTSRIERRLNDPK